MQRARLVLPLLAALLVPTAALAVLGLRAYRGESARSQARFRERAESAAAAARDALQRSLTRVGRGELGALALRIGAGGELLEPAPARTPAAPTSNGPRDRAMYRFVQAEIDALEHAGNLDEARARLAPLAERADDPWLAAWALTARAAIEERSGNTQAADELRRELVQRYPDERDERGLRRSFAARLTLADREPDATDALLALYADAIADHVTLDETATALFKEQLLERLRPSQHARVATLAAQDAEREHVRRFHAAWRAGISDWVARGAPGGAALFEAPPDPLDAEPTGVLVVAIEPAVSELRGGALTLADLARAALAEPEIAAYAALGFGLRVSDANGAVLAGEQQDGQRAVLATLQPTGALQDLTVEAVPLDAEAFFARERASSRIFAALVALALLIAGVAAVVTFRALAREVAAAREREAFVAAVTHELKAPLASIRLLAELLEQGGVSEDKVREFGRRTVAEADRLARLVSSVLELARIEQGGVRRLETLDLNAVARAAVATLEPQAHEQGFELALQPAAAPVTVRAEAAALEGALINLLDNALKYSDRPHAIEVSVTADEHGTASVCVRDRGRGVAPADARAIFEPFRRSGDELTRDRPGVGLGLALVREIAAAHGGRARYSARPGGGSEFSIELPRVQPGGNA